MIVAQKRPGLARIVVTALACVIAFAGTLAAYMLAEAAGQETLARGIGYIFPITTAWVATALTQHLMRKAGQ